MPRRPSSLAVDGVEAAVGSTLAALVRRAASQHAPRIAVALSGGRDSMALLHAAARVAPALGVVVEALHVHHGLSPHADAWSDFCRAQCALRAVPLHVERVVVAPAGGESTEALARAQRFAALRRTHADAVLLAHHADDQAETLLLQLMRGAGPRGLAGMPVRQVTEAGPAFLRPLLDLAGRDLADYADAQALTWIEDESNADKQFRRNALRHDVMPVLRRVFPGLPGTLVRAATHQAEAARLLDDLAALDAVPLLGEDPAFGPTLGQDGLAALAEARGDRGRNVLRWFLRRHGLRAPSQGRLDVFLAQCTNARADAHTRLVHDGREIGVHTGRVIVHPPTPLPFCVTWRGEPVLGLPGGTLHATPAVGAGVAANVAAAGLEIRPRAGGERLHVAHDTPQGVSAFLASRATPLWQRASWPLVWHGGVLIAVPGLGIDPRYAAAPAAPGLTLRYEPAT